MRQFKVVAVLILLLGGAGANAQTTRPADPDNWQAVLKELQPGDTMELADGRYVGQITVPATAWGVPDKPTTIRATTLWGAKFTAHGDTGDGINIIPYGTGRPHDLVIDGLCLHGGETTGIRISMAQRVTVKRCRVSHFQHNAILFSGTHIVIEDCLLERCGGDTGGHAIYYRGSCIFITGNLIRDCFNYGIHGYEQDNPTPCNDNVITGNIIYDHPRGAGLLVWGGVNNWVVGNIVVNNRKDLDIRYPDPSNVIRDNITDLAATGGTNDRTLWQVGKWPPLDAWCKRMGIETTVQPWPWETSK